MFIAVIALVLSSGLAFACYEGDSECINKTHYHECIGGAWSTAKTCGADHVCVRSECVYKRNSDDGDGGYTGDIGSGGVAQVCTDWTDWEETNETADQTTECLDDGRCRNCSNVTYRTYCIYMDGRSKETDYSHSKKKIEYQCDPWPAECEYVYNKTETRYELKSRNRCKVCHDEISYLVCKYRGEIYENDTQIETTCERKYIDCPESVLEQEAKEDEREDSKVDEKDEQTKEFENLAKETEDKEDEQEVEKRTTTKSKYADLTSNNDDIIAKYGLVNIAVIVVVILGVLFAFYKMFLSKPPE
jgi:hypothetical protein